MKTVGDKKRTADERATRASKRANEWKNQNQPKSNTVPFSPVSIVA